MFSSSVWAIMLKSLIIQEKGTTEHTLFFSSSLFHFTFISDLKLSHSATVSCQPPALREAVDMTSITPSLTPPKLCQEFPDQISPVISLLIFTWTSRNIGAEILNLLETERVNRVNPKANCCSGFVKLLVHPAGYLICSLPLCVLLI